MTARYLPLVGLLACAPAPQQAAPVPAPAATPVAQAPPPSPGARPSYTDADVRFMQGMIPHHQQAIEMSALVPGRTTTRDIMLLAQRITISQEDEIVAMQRWLRERGQPLVMDHGDHASHEMLMPGMLTSAEMDRLAAAHGAGFDRLYLEFMIRHHQGAIRMVAELFSSRGAGQDPEMFQFASEVDADQQMEIARMQRLLETLSSR